VRAIASQRLKVPSPSPYDQQARVIKDSRMQGSASGSFYHVSTYTISWDIKGDIMEITPATTTR